MTHLIDEPIATHQGKGWSSKEKTSIYLKEDYTIIEIVTDKYKKEIRFRNVGEKNNEASIQFNITEYTFKTNRSKHTSFDIPLPLVDLFISKIKSPTN